jgi:hypothetical protein
LKASFVVYGYALTFLSFNHRNVVKEKQENLDKIKLLNLKISVDENVPKGRGITTVVSDRGVEMKCRERKIPSGPKLPLMR